MKKSLGAMTVVMPLPVWVIGSYGRDRLPCLMTAAWCGMCSSEPPSVAVALRKTRHSYANILSCRAFTVNIPAVQHADMADYIGLVSGRDTDKFLQTGLTPVGSELVDAPYIKEFPIVLECVLLNAVEIGSHTLFIGRIADVKADVRILGDNGLPDMAKVDPLVCSPSDKNYYRVGPRVGQAYFLGRKVGLRNRPCR